MNMKELVEMSGIEVLAKVKNKVHFSQNELDHLVFEDFIKVKEEVMCKANTYAIVQTVLKVNDEYIMIEWLKDNSTSDGFEYEQPVMVKKVVTDGITKFVEE